MNAERTLSNLIAAFTAITAFCALDRCSSYEGLREPASWLGTLDGQTARAYPKTGAAAPESQPAPLAPRKNYEH